MTSTPELWDLVDKDGAPLQRLHPRGVPLPPGTFHLVVCIVTREVDGMTLLSRRSPEKEYCPGMWEFQGGSVVAGEDVRHAARRELSEETGLVASPQDLVLAHSGFVLPDDSARYVWFRVDLPQRQPLPRPQVGETDQFVWVDDDHLLEFLSRGELTPADTASFWKLGGVGAAWGSGRHHTLGQHLLRDMGRANPS